MPWASCIRHFKSSFLQCGKPRECRNSWIVTFHKSSFRFNRKVETTGVTWPETQSHDSIVVLSMNRSRDVSMRQTYRYGSRLGRMLELSMVTLGSRQIPTIFLQHLQNIFDFVLFHIIECFDYAGKGTNNNTFKQIFALKVLKDNERCTNPKRVLHGMNP